MVGYCAVIKGAKKKLERGVIKAAAWFFFRRGVIKGAEKKNRRLGIFDSHCKIKNKQIFVGKTEKKKLKKFYPFFRIDSKKALKYQKN